MTQQKSAGMPCLYTTSTSGLTACSGVGNRRSLLLLVALLLGQALPAHHAPARTVQPFETIVSPPVKRSADRSAREYIVRAGSMELLAIRSAELAIQRSSKANIRSVALRALRDHTGLSKQLSYAGRRLNMLPSAALLPEHEQMLLRLISSPDLGGTYLRQQRAASASAYRLHREYLRTGTSPTLRPVAQRAIAILSSEIERLRRL